MDPYANAAVATIDPSMWTASTLASSAIAGTAGVAMDGMTVHWIGVPSNVLGMALAGSCVALTFCPPAEKRGIWKSAAIAFSSMIGGAAMEPLVAELLGWQRFPLPTAFLCGALIHWVAQMLFSDDVRGRCIALLDAAISRVRGR